MSTGREEKGREGEGEEVEREGKRHTIRGRERPRGNDRKREG